MEEPKLRTNLDTDLLKLVAIISMTIDHIGDEFFLPYPVFRWIGRVAFPLFCYCMTVGMLYTWNIRKYMLRLGIFAIISQPFWILAFNSDDILGNLFNLNIFFTLFVSLATAWAAKEKKWWRFAFGILLLSVINFDYATTGVILMLIFYYCRNKPVLGMILYVLNYLPALYWNRDDALALKLGEVGIGWEVFTFLALPLIYIPTKSNLKINKWFFYLYYPAHLFVIFLIKQIA